MFFSAKRAPNACERGFFERQTRAKEVFSSAKRAQSGVLERKTSAKEGVLIALSGVLEGVWRGWDAVEALLGR
jgi:hypothetical protein